MMKTTFKLVCSELEDDELQDLTQKICRSIEEETGIEVERPKSVVSPGAKGGIVELINIADFCCNVASELAVIGIYSVFMMYFQRPSLKDTTVIIDITKPDGTTIKIASRDITLEHIQQLVIPPNDAENTETANLPDNANEPINN